MKITFLGTAAATSIPLMFCRCNTCEQARKLGGRDFRKRSSLLINQDLLIDLGPDIMSASFMHGVSIADVRYCLQTHSHSDHFDASHLSTRIPEYAVEFESKYLPGKTFSIFCCREISNNGISYKSR